jgi:NAD(P)H-nitrite reductase large subunit
MKQVIIGAGAAGVTAAQTIKKINPSDEVTIISIDDIIHSRCMLHKYISGERDDRSVSFVDEDFTTENDIRWSSANQVLKIDTEKNTVVTDRGDIPYDNLLIATGANSVTPPVGDLRTAKNTFGLRNLSDAKAIAEKATDSKKVAIVGAGLVGLDAAYALLELGKEITVIEMLDSVLAINLDKHSAAAYQALFEQHGCTFRLGIGVTGTKGTADHIDGLILGEGEVIDCDMVIMAVGVRPATGMLEGSGIQYERSVQVDEYLKTNISNVFAAGDVSGLSGIWPNARKQGEVAAKNMCGLKTKYEDTFAIKNTLNFFGLITLSLGVINEQDGDEVLIREDRFTYKKLILRAGKVVGVILQGDIAGSGFWQYLIKQQIDVSHLGKSIWKVSYADFFGTESNGEYKWVV